MTLENIRKVMTSMGLIEDTDYEFLPYSYDEEVVTQEATFDEDGNELTPEVTEMQTRTRTAYERLTFLNGMLKWEESDYQAKLDRIELEERVEALGDIMMLVNKHLEGVERSSSDYINPAGFTADNIGTDKMWRVANATKPTLEELEALKQTVDSEISQAQINADARKLLADTDWKVLRHRDQIDAGVSTSLSQAEFDALLAERQTARDSVVE
jgi:hypothetical protein